MNVARKFYGNILGLKESRSSAKWIVYDFYGNEIVCHLIENDYRGVDNVEKVDGGKVTVPNSFGLISLEEFDELVEKLKKEDVKFIIEPSLISKGQKDE